jgi:hypothetical protein
MGLKRLPVSQEVGYTVGQPIDGGQLLPAGVLRKMGSRSPQEGA